jgi:hypothetical protein
MVKENRRSILGIIDTKTKVLALVTLVIEATFLGSIAALPKDMVFAALVVCALVFAIVVIGVVMIELAELRRKDQPSAAFLPSPLTADSPLLNEIIRGAVHTVCRGVTVPKTPEEARLRAFIFKKHGNQLVCTHFWAPDNLRVREVVGLSFDLDRTLVDKVVVLKAFFDRRPARTTVQPMPKNMKGVKGEVSEDIEFVLAVPIYNRDKENSVWGVVDFDTSNDIGKVLLSNDVSDTVMYHLAEHLRLIFSLSEGRDITGKTA